MQSNQSQNINKEGASSSFFNSEKIKKKMKKFFIFTALNLFSFFRLFKKIIVFLIKQFIKVITFIFLYIHKGIKIIILNSHRLYSLFKKQIQKIVPSNQKISHLFIRYPIFFIIIIVIIGLIVSDNFRTKDMNTDIIGQETIFYHFFNEQQEELIKETETSIVSDQFLSNETPFMGTEIKDQTEQKETIIIQEGTFLIKPNISVTVETPQIRTKPIKYIIKAGDVISGIARKFNVSTNTILWENGLTDNSLIQPGDELIILPVTGVIHKVAKDETLKKIAKKYNVDEMEILAINELMNDRLLINQKIIIPGGEKYFPSIFLKKKPVKKWTPSLLGKFISSKDKGIFIWPTSGHLITQYSHWGHTAIDIAGKNNSSPIYASNDGIVSSVIYSNRGYGKYVKISHSNNMVTLYGHTSKIFVKNGQKVKRGQVIGLLGSTGRSTGPHIHFEIRINGIMVNPLKYVR